MAVFGWKLNFFNVIVFPTLIGNAVDNGVHWFRRFKETGEDAAEVQQELSGALSASTATTATGYAGMILAHHAGLRSIGSVAVLGLVCCLFTGLVVMPGVLRLLALRHRRRAEARRPAATLRVGRPSGRAREQGSATMSEAVTSPLLDAPGLAVRGADSERTASAAPALLRGIATNVFTILVGGLGAFFTLLIARLLGEAALGGYLLAWATADLASRWARWGSTRARPLSWPAAGPREMPRARARSSASRFLRGWARAPSWPAWAGSFWGGSEPPTRRPIS